MQTYTHAYTYHIISSNRHPGILIPLDIILVCMIKQLSYGSASKNNYEKDSDLQGHYGYKSLCMYGTYAMTCAAIATFVADVNFFHEHYD